MEESFKKALAPLQDVVEEKFKDPYLRVFVLSALVWNYQVFLYIFSDLSPDTKFALIQRSLTKWSYIVPIGTSFFYNLIFPIIFFYLYKWSDGLNIWVRNAREKELLSLTTHKERIQDLMNQRDQLNNELSKKDIEIGRLKASHENEMKNIENSFSTEKSELANKYLKEIRTLQESLNETQSESKTDKVALVVKYLKATQLDNEFINFATMVGDAKFESKKLMSTELFDIAKIFGLIVTKKYRSKERTLTEYSLSLFGKDVLRSIGASETKTTVYDGA